MTSLGHNEFNENMSHVSTSSVPADGIELFCKDISDRARTRFDSWVHSGPTFERVIL